MTDEPLPVTLTAALKAKGFVCLPNLWVKVDDYPAIKATAEQYADEVNATRVEVYERRRAAGMRMPKRKKPVSRPDEPELPIELSDEERKKQEMDAAWEKFENRSGYNSYTGYRR